jgi:hypothetical protein
MEKDLKLVVSNISEAIKDTPQLFVKEIIAEMLNAQGLYGLFVIVQHIADIIHTDDIVDKEVPGQQISEDEQETFDDKTKQKIIDELAKIKEKLAEESYYVVVQGDIGDDDIISKHTKISINDIPRVKKLFLIIKNAEHKNSYNWQSIDGVSPEHYINTHMTEDDFHFIEKFVPYDEDNYIIPHSIVNVSIIKRVTEETII